MSEPTILVPQHVLDDWRAALQQREPRALELALALALTLPARPETNALAATLRAAQDASPLEISGAVRAMLESAYEKYSAFAEGDFQRVDVGNANVLAYERCRADERVLVVNNLARVPEPIKLRGYVGREGWDILNRVEFTCPPRAQLEAYEFLWLLVE